MDLERALKRLTSNGCDIADVFFEEREEASIICEDKKIEKINFGLDRGVGLRCFCSGQTFYGFTNDLKDLMDLAGYLSSQISCSKKGITVGEIKQIYPKIKIPPWESPLKSKVDLVRRAERTAWGKSPLIKQVKVVYKEVRQRVKIINSLGNFINEERTRLVFYVQAVASDGNVLQTGYEPIGGSLGLELFERIPVERVAEIASERAVKMLKARPAPSGPMPVVLSSEAGGTMIHEAIGHGLEADLALEGLSVYANRIGEKVASPLVTVIDDPTLPFHYGSYSYDDEGMPAKRVVLMENGVLKSYLFNLEYASKVGEETNGHGRRESYRFKPIPRMSNTYIAPGKTPPEDIIKSVQKGLFVKKMGGGQVNTVNGDFIFEASEAYLLKKGEICEPVRGANLVGNGPKVLETIEMVGNDIGFNIGTCGKNSQLVPVTNGQPTLLLPEIIVGGTKE